MTDRGRGPDGGPEGALHDELESWLSLRTDELIAEGMDPARRASESLDRARRSGPGQGERPRRPAGTARRADASRRSLRRARDGPVAGIRGGGRARALARDRRECRDLLGRPRGPSSPAAVSRAGPPRRAAPPRLESHGAGQLPRLAPREPRVRRHGRGRVLGAQPDGCGRVRERAGAARDRRAPSDARRVAAAREALRLRRGRAGPRPCRDPGRRALAPALRSRPGRRRADDLPGRREVRGRRRHAARLRLPGVLGEGEGAVGAARVRRPRLEPDGLQPARFRAPRAPARPWRPRGRRSRPSPRVSSGAIRARTGR